MRHIFYLHGFASSARSKKAAFFAERLAALGIELRCPDFNEPDFSTLTVSRMLAQVEGELAGLPPGPLALIGSSLGGFVALHLAARSRAALASGSRETAGRLDRVILMAPALDFARMRMSHLGEDGVARWRETNRLEVFHYGYGEVRHVGYELYEDARQYDAFAIKIDVPMLIFQGRRDESVDASMVERFAATRPHATLRLLDDDHQLLGSLERIWGESARFLGLPRP